MNSRKSELDKNFQIFTRSNPPAWGLAFEGEATVEFSEDMKIKPRSKLYYLLNSYPGSVFPTIWGYLIGDRWGLITGGLHGGNGRREIIIVDFKIMEMRYIHDKKH